MLQLLFVVFSRITIMMTVHRVTPYEHAMSPCGIRWQTFDFSEEYYFDIFVVLYFGVFSAEYPLASLVFTLNIDLIMEKRKVFASTHVPWCSVLSKPSIKYKLISIKNPLSIRLCNFHAAPSVCSWSIVRFSPMNSSDVCAKDVNSSYDLRGLIMRQNWIYYAIERSARDADSKRIAFDPFIVGNCLLKRIERLIQLTKRIQLKNKINHSFFCAHCCVKNW